jgi:hypothetical protein
MFKSGEKTNYKKRFVSILMRFTLVTEIGYYFYEMKESLNSCFLISYFTIDS